MHVRTTKRTTLPAGGFAPEGTTLDLPEAEALPMIEAGDAVLLFVEVAAGEAVLDDAEAEAAAVSEEQAA